MLDSDSESYYRAFFLVSRYNERETHPWAQFKKSAEQTTVVIRDVAENLVEHYDRIGDEQLKTLFRLCQNSSDGLSAAEKRDSVRDLDFPTADIERITEAINDSIGSVGAAMQEPKLHVGGEKNIEAEQKLHACFEQIVQNYDSEAVLIQAVRDLVEIDFYGVQSGRMSPILHYLVPEVFPLKDTGGADNTTDCEYGTLANSTTVLRDPNNIITLVCTNLKTRR